MPNPLLFRVEPCSLFRVKFEIVTKALIRFRWILRTIQPLIDQIQSHGQKESTELIDTVLGHIHCQVFRRTTLNDSMNVRTARWQRRGIVNLSTQHLSFTLINAFENMTPDVLVHKSRTCSRREDRCLRTMKVSLYPTPPPHTSSTIPQPPSGQPRSEQLRNRSKWPSLK